MTAARLRAAAAVLREAAEGATPGPWREEDTALIAADGTWLMDYPDMEKADATYIATLSPPVALAVAEWLEEVAAVTELRARVETMKDNGYDTVTVQTNPKALAVADAVLGDRAEVGS